MKNIGKYLAVGFASLVSLLAVYVNSRDSENSVLVNGSRYQVERDSIVQTQSSFLEDGVIKIGVASDIEGDLEGAIKSAEVMRENNVDAVILAGDLYENEGIRKNPRYPDSIDNVSEMVNGITPYAFLNVPVFVIPGNHENREVYKKALEILKKSFDNVFDINRRKVDLAGVNLVGIGGYHDARFIDNRGFFLGKRDYNFAKDSLEDFAEQREPIVLVSHGPPRSEGEIDYVEGFGNVGDERIREILEERLDSRVINVHGHIHEGGGVRADYGKDGSVFDLGVNYAINAASVTSHGAKDGGGSATIMTINGLNKNIDITRIGGKDEK